VNGGERVLCVRRSELFPDGPFRGIRPEALPALRELVGSSPLYLPRDEVEEDPSYQQVIPYAVFRHGPRYLLTRRLAAGGERRLADRCSLGIGGHINPVDGAEGDPLEGGLRREWEEEVEYRGGFAAAPLGVLKDESEPVGRVHVGLVYLIEADSAEISIRERHKLAGELLDAGQLAGRYPQMETWSQIVYDHIVERRI
jgi:predicted NUDIX family phosphoesterase